VPAELDPTIAAMCDLPAPRSPFANVPQIERALWWLNAIGCRLLADMAAVLEAPRIHTGYQPKAARTETRARQKEREQVAADSQTTHT
jgi:hypothetical protein